MKITKRQLRRIIREATEEVTMYDQGREDSFAGIRPQFPDEDYMMGYNEAQEDAGLPRMQAPSDSGQGKKLDPRKLKGAFAGKQRGSRPGEIALDFGKDIGTYNYIDESQVKITKRQLRRIIREAMTSDVPDVMGTIGDGKFQPREQDDALTTPEDFKALQPGDNLSLNGKPIVVIGVSPMTGEVDYVDRGKATRKYFDYRMALVDEPGEMPELDVVYLGPGEPPQNTRLPRK